MQIVLNIGGSDRGNLLKRDFDLCSVNHDRDFVTSHFNFAHNDRTRT